MREYKLVSGQPILIVDDSDDDFEATERAFRRAGNLNNPIVRCENGKEALDYLTQASKPDAPSTALPGLILLDLNMPGVDGRTVLKHIKDDGRLKRIPVIVMTTSDDDRDVSACYAAGANSYVKKPVDLDGFFEAVRRLKEFWIEIAVLPRGTE